MEKKLTKAEIKELAIMSQVYNTVYGKMTLSKMVLELGKPIVVLAFARIECKSKGANKMIIVDRFIDAELHFSKDVVVKGMKKEFVLTMDYSGIKKVYVRHPNYNSSRPPIASKKELKEWRAKNEKQVQRQG